MVQPQANTPTATLNDRLLVDKNGDARLDAGDTLRYTLEIINCGDTSSENVQVTGERDTNMQLVTGSVQVSVPEAAPCSTTTAPASGDDDDDDDDDGGSPVVPPVDPTAPSVVNTTPADNATEAALSANISIEFNETVNVAGDWFEVVCAISGTFNISSGNITLSGGPLTFTLDPNVDLQTGETCTVRVFATQVTDVDANDPPDNMAANYGFAFTTETPPTVTTTNPANGATTIPNSSDLEITFSEPVNVSAASFTLECPAGTPFAGGFAVSGSGTNAITVNPTGSLPSGTSCQVVIIAANVSDVDANDPPDLLDGNGDLVEGDDYTFSFTTDADAAPTVQSITPANGAVDVPTNTTIEIVFSELVNISSAADFSLECPFGGPPQGFTVTTPGTLPASTTTVIITPAGLLPDATTCTITVYAGVTDTDADDPPDNMVADFTVTFTTEDAIIMNTDGLLASVFDLGGSPVSAQGNPNLAVSMEPIHIGTIPPNSKVSITLDMQVGVAIPSGTNYVSLQGIVSGSNFATFRTDDPESGALNDTTLTPLGSSQSVGNLPGTGEIVWWRSLLVWGLRLALLCLGITGIIAVRRRLAR